MTENDHFSVLFVCMGNICRSPAAEALLKHIAADRGIEKAVKIDSAGTHGLNIGKQPDLRMRTAAAIRGYYLQSRSRKLTADDLSEFDLVVAMDKENLANISALTEQPRCELRLFSHFLDDNWPDEVPDPYHGANQDFDTVLDMLEAGCPKIVNYLTHQLERQT